MTVDEKSPHAVSFTKPSDLEFRVERTFDHPIERVWAAYTDPALIPQRGSQTWNRPYVPLGAEHKRRQLQPEGRSGSSVHARRADRSGRPQRTQRRRLSSCRGRRRGPSSGCPLPIGRAARESSTPSKSFYSTLSKKESTRCLSSVAAPSS